MIISFVATLSFFIHYFNDLSGYHRNWFTHLCGIVYLITAFPAVILYMVHRAQNWWGLAFSIITAALFYSAVIEVVLNKYRRK
jgi:membrane protein YdbS with pleckstrin-like domain